MVQRVKSTPVVSKKKGAAKAEEQQEEGGNKTKSKRKSSLSNLIIVPSQFACRLGSVSPSSAPESQAPEGRYRR